MDHNCIVDRVGYHQRKPGARTESERADFGKRRGEGPDRNAIRNTNGKNLSGRNARPYFHSERKE